GPSARRRSHGHSEAPMFQRCMTAPARPRQSSRLDRKAIPLAFWVCVAIIVAPRWAPAQDRVSGASLMDATVVDAPVTDATVAEPTSSGRSFVVDTNPFLLGQAADWLDETHVVWQDPVTRDEGGDGQIQIYRSTLDGQGKTCLTCGLDGPNQVPVVQP